MREQTDTHDVPTDIKPGLIPIFPPLINITLTFLIIYPVTKIMNGRMY